MKYEIAPHRHNMPTSLRSSERGLKYNSKKTTSGALEVAPFVGAWIEILKTRTIEKEIWSLRSSERGLKLYTDRIKSRARSRSVRRSVD